jgi:hypothetical protein
MVRRAICTLLGASLLVSTTGCSTAKERADRDRELVKVGMTRDDVADLLGEPFAWKENQEGYEIWLYAYRPSVGHYLTWGTVDVAAVMVQTALLLGVIASLVWLTEGRLPQEGLDALEPLAPEPADENRYQRFTFRIGFKRESGLVAFVTSSLPE